MVAASFPLESHMPLRGLWLAAVLWLTAAIVAPAYAQQGLVAVPQLTARVTDLTGTLTADQSSALEAKLAAFEQSKGCLLYTSPSPRDRTRSRMPSSA